MAVKAECLRKTRRSGRTTGRASRLERRRRLRYDAGMREKEALVLDGGLGDGSLTHGACEIVGVALKGAGWRVRRLALREIDIAPCLGCFGCWVKTPGVCVIDDAGRDVARQIAQSDLLVYITPLTFGGYSSELKKVLDRSIPNILPLFRRVKGEVHHVKRYARHPRLLGIGVSAKGPIDPEDEELFETLVHRNAINMAAPRNATCVLGVTDDDEIKTGRIERAVRRVIGS